MNELLEQLATDPWGRLVLQHLATGGLSGVYLFLLVGARLAGVFVLAPCFMTNAIPFHIRVGLVFLLSLIIAPTLSATGQDIGDVKLAFHTSTIPSVLPETVADFAGMIASEVGLGAMFGVGLIAVLSGLKLAGEWFDRHGGLGLGAVFNPEWSAGESACGSLVQLSGIAAFLLIEPLGGQWRLLQSLVHSFQAIPVGSVSWSMSAVELVAIVVQQSLLLGIRVAMPLAAMMTLVDVALAFFCRGTPMTLSASCLAIRMGVGLIVLALTMTAIPDVMTATAIHIFPFINGNR